MIFIRLCIICLSVMLFSSPAHAIQSTSVDLLQQSQENLALGYFREATTQLQQAEAIAIQQQDVYTLTLIKGLQGYIALQHQDYSVAEQLLTAVYEQAQKNAWTDLEVRFALYLGQLSERKQKHPEAQKFFQQALAHQNDLKDKTLLVSAYYQLANTYLDSQHLQQAGAELDHASALLENLPVNAVSSQLWLNIGYQGLRLHQKNPQQSLYLKKTFYALQKALSQAEEFKQFRTQASALKYLAQLYKEQRGSEAIKLLLAGIHNAQKADANDLLIDLEWQLGQLYQNQQNPNQAMAAYRRAVKHIESIRIDIPVSYEKGRSSFRDTFAPIYLALADLLLTQAPHASSSTQQSLLKEAQDTIELMKKSELEDYFQSRCDISAAPINLQKTDHHAAAIYPIPLANRLEIIVYTANGLHQFTSPVSAKKLEEYARLFSSHLRNYSDFRESKKQAQPLYQWLIAPIKPLLEKQHIETLLYIPDGSLRLVPLSALYDGKKFLIEDYAVVTSPGMSLIESSAKQYSQQNILLAGMSVPGDVVRDLPESLLGDLVGDVSDSEGETRQLTRSLKRAMNSNSSAGLTPVEKAAKSHELQDLLKKPVVIEKLQKMLALPGVDTEIKQLASQNNMPYLLNESFSLEKFKDTLTGSAHKILHIASHGFFGSTAEDSFIMTYDKILNLTQLENLLNADYFKLYPIDLITLSACQTAEGDDRSPLGISGVAIKSKVHTALGSLWPVSDEATSELMTNFYKNLKSSDFNKAKALQQAEIKLLKQKKFANPSLWSPFVLVGNWQ